ncbi:MAG TPA: hypothetical protein ENK64_02000 [Flavobacteriales bacterium]|nr:hypothetical protein [Flavobacteriales bacterium]
MSSIKDLKKEINYLFGEVIDEANYKQLLNPDVDGQQVEAIIEEAVAAYEDFYKQINEGRKAEDKKAYFKNLTKAIEETADQLVDKINAL